MAHSDNNGLVLPPKVAPIQVVIVPIPGKGFEDTVLPAARKDELDQLTRGANRAGPFDRRNGPQLLDDRVQQPTVRCGAVLDDLSQIHHSHTIADVLNHSQIVGNKQHG